MKKLLLFLILFAAPSFAQTRYYLGPWVWAVDAQSNGQWQRPSNAIAAIDLRTMSQQGSPGPTANGFGLFATTGTLSSPYVAMGQGNDMATVNVTNTMRNNWESRLGYRPVGTNLAAILWDQLTAGSDPSGAAGPKPLMPGHDNQLELRLGVYRRTEGFRFGVHSHTAKVEAVHQAAYRTVHDDAVAKRVPDDLPGKVLDMWVEKYGISKADKATWERLVPSDLRSTATLVPHATTITENFNGTDSDTVCAQLSCTEVDGDWDLVSNKARLVSNFGSTMRDVRADSDLSSVDHYSQIVADNESGTVSYVATRFASAAETFYYYGIDLNHPASGEWEIGKVVTGTKTALSTVGSVDTSGAPATLYGQSNGSSLELKVGGVSKTTVTDSAITTGTRCGVVGYDPAGVTGPEFDDLTCADLAAATDNTVLQTIMIQ